MIVTKWKNNAKYQFYVPSLIFTIGIPSFRRICAPIYGQCYFSDLQRVAFATHCAIFRWY